MLESIASAPTSAQIGIWIACFAFLLGAVNQALKFFDRFREVPPTHEKYATKAELQKVDGRLSEEVADLRHTITANYNKIMESGAEGRRRIYQQMNDITKVLSRLEGKLEK